jgi:2-methylaconitate cis-trans-isomerase PrpF
MLRRGGFARGVFLLLSAQPENAVARESRELTRIKIEKPEAAQQGDPKS